MEDFVSNRGERILISGAGIGGLSLALDYSGRDSRSPCSNKPTSCARSARACRLRPMRPGVSPTWACWKRCEARPRAERRRHQALSDRRASLRLRDGRAMESTWGAPYVQIHRADLQQVSRGRSSAMIPRPFASVPASMACEMRAGSDGRQRGGGFLGGIIWSVRTA